MINQYDLSFSEFVHNDPSDYFRPTMNRFLIEKMCEDAGSLKPLVRTKVAVFIDRHTMLK